MSDEQERRDVWRQRMEDPEFRAEAEAFTERLDAIERNRQAFAESKAARQAETDARRAEGRKALADRKRRERRAAQERAVRLARYEAAVAAIVRGLGNPTDEYVAEKLGVDDATIQRWRARGDIP